MHVLRYAARMASDRQWRFGWTEAGVVLRAIAWLLLVMLLSTHSSRENALRQVHKTGVLRAAMVNDPTSYYLGPAGYTGFDYDLINDFADYLGASLDIVLVDTPEDALAVVRSGNAQIAAISMPVTAERAEAMRFSRPLRYRTPELVRKMGNAEAEQLEALASPIIVPRGSAHATWLAQLEEEVPSLKWDTRADAEPEALLREVASGDLDLTVAGSDLVAITKRYYPRLAVVRQLGAPRPLAWALAPERGESLYRELSHYLRLLGSKELQRLRDRYFGHIERLDYVDAVTLATHFETRLPRYREKFEQAAKENGIDWRLLAAVGYQESHWDNSAVSPTGVRGIMQITQQTARFLKISDRTDPSEAIAGAARYLRSLHGRLPESIQEPDRSWFMLAAYNIGLGHVLDARRLTQRMGDDPDRWVDVREHLPLLTQPRHYKQLRYGYARGPEAVHYVGHVRTYFDMLVWLTSREEETPVPVDPRPREMRPPKGENPLAIEQPLL